MRYFIPLFSAFLVGCNSEPMPLPEDDLATATDMARTRVEYDFAIESAADLAEMPDLRPVYDFGDTDALPCGHVGPGAGQPCCAYEAFTGEGVCFNKAVCSGGYCTPCGEKNGPCCADGSCKFVGQTCQPETYYPYGRCKS